MRAPAIMIQGTASNVGKSLMVAGLCRYFMRKGIKVAPFKAQNMALNSFVTPDGLEIGRAQAMQAEAAGIPCSVLMNPVLLKPESDKHCQVVLKGRPHKGMSAMDYQMIKPQVRNLVCESLEQLRREYELVIIEGAGSPAEVNLKNNDIVNMFVATTGNVPVILVGDIDRGGVFAAFVGTLMLLEQHEQDLVAGFIINKFRGDIDLLLDGVNFLESYTKKTNFGVVPMLNNLRIAEEDSLGLEFRNRYLSTNKKLINIGIIRLPRMSNYDEFDSLENEAQIHLAYISDSDAIINADLIIIPGSKSTMEDLNWLKEEGFAVALLQRISMEKPTIGICGGCQMLGKELHDPLKIESEILATEGLGVFDFHTIFKTDKHTRQTQVQMQSPILGLEVGSTFHGYEIHMGEIVSAETQQIFKVNSSTGEQQLEGHGKTNILATMVHGLFDEDLFRESILNYLCKLKNLNRQESTLSSRDQEFDRLADHLEQSLQMNKIHDLIKNQNDCFVLDIH